MTRARWIAVLIVTLALHAMMMQWFSGRALNTRPPPERIPVQIALLKPVRVELAAAHPAAPAAPRTSPAAPEPHRAPTLSARATTSPAPQASPQTAPHALPAATSSTASTASTVSTTASHGVRFSPPPSGNLPYDVYYDNVQYAPNVLYWRFDGQRYDMSLSVIVPFAGRFGWESHGHLDAFGLAPDQYVEHRGHRPMERTTFDRKSRQIAFSRTQASLPALPDGAQDRFSVVMQLASLVRGHPDAYRAGVAHEFYVADSDSGETWRVMTLGDEIVQTGQGFSVNARHFMRMPRHANDKRRIDVWLAPSLGWIPVKLIQIEPNGKTIKLIWRGDSELTKTKIENNANNANINDINTKTNVNNTNAGDISGSGAHANDAPDTSAQPYHSAPEYSP